MDQDLALQREVLESAGVNTVFEEKASGIKREVAPNCRRHSRFLAKAMRS
jgi:hypothetical protein